MSTIYRSIMMALLTSRISLLLLFVSLLCLAAHTFGWTEFEIDQDSQQLTVTTFGISPYTEGQLNLNPSDIMTRSPEIVSQFIVTPTGWITVDVTLSELNTSSAKTRLTPLISLALLVLAGVGMRGWE